MQIDLFKNEAVKQDCNRIGGQIFSRKYKIGHSLEPLDAIESDVAEFLAYRDRVRSLLKRPKCMIQVGNLKSDSYAEIELLGIGEYSKSFTVTIDFSRALDFILSELTMCRQSSIRSMPDYDTVSEALLNYNFDKVGNINFNKFMGLDPYLDLFITSIIKQHSEELKTLSIRETTYSVLTDFYGQVTQFLQDVQNYVARAISIEMPRTQSVYRSKTLSTIILSSNIPVTEEILLKGEHGDTVLSPQSYRMYEYAKKLSRG